MASRWDYIRKPGYRPEAPRSGTYSDHVEQYTSYEGSVEEEYMVALDRRLPTQI